MALPVTDISVLQTYLQGVMARADHHAAKVNEIALVLVGAIVWRKDDQPIKVMTRDGNMKNVLWVRMGGSLYAFSYNSSSGTIEMRRDTVQGAVLHSFTNQTTLKEVRAIFEAL